jgi:competence ComEA-like helix-hairpin-helix protein
MESERRPPAAPLVFDRSQRLGLLVLGAAMLAGCLLWLVGRGSQLPAGAEPAPGDAPYRVNVNTAGWPELSLVPGLGETLARRIVEYRGARGPLRSLDELVEVNGIGRVRLEQMRPYLVLTDAAPQP